MIDRHMVVVARKWHEPFVRVSVTDEDIKVVMTLEDFAEAVAHEIGANPEAVARTFDKIISQLKRESARAV